MTSQNDECNMKKWKIAQRRMAWQVLSSTGDRNIAGHTAKIPEGFQFIEGDGPRGLGIDFSDSGKISELAQAIIPQASVSKKDKLSNALEGVWRDVHGKHVPTQLLPQDPTGDDSVNKGQTAGLTAFFEAMSLPQTSLLGLLKAGCPVADSVEEEEEEEEREETEPEPAVMRSLTQTQTKTPAKIPKMVKAKSLPRNLLKKKQGRSQTPDSGFNKQRSQTPDGGFKPRSQTPDSGLKPRSQTPDSGFNSDCSNLELEERVLRRGPLDMSNPLLSSFVKLKREEPGRRSMEKGEGETLSTVPEHALLSLHEQKSKTELKRHSFLRRRSSTVIFKQKSSSSLRGDASPTQRKVKTVVKTNFACSTLANAMLPVAQIYEVQNGSHKDSYQSFTRRRTKGLMYNTLDPMACSDYYSHTSNKRSRSKLM